MTEQANPDAGAGTGAQQGLIDAEVAASLVNIAGREDDRQRALVDREGRVAARERAADVADAAQDQRGISLDRREGRLEARLDQELIDVETRDTRTELSRPADPTA